ncbi:hypothetical protein CBLAS_0700 [Campylobacter blaseri]|uniref:Campylobacter invasion antigen D C-terminal domain-containing protein n=1 Tax=Campylobacter blaseri TaxID=2042961 RepID=A0A2P8R271_9BACT|nr:hypothetical protein CQ405_02360 [Campylobacter blaseri]PSM54241.1 hypothetical protein CRN67_02360 [Campylobacter blaseri]QKF85891.1 hypothetical protein CBLAS_0700 [Campylobacter blaseri]
MKIEELTKLIIEELKETSKNINADKNLNFQTSNEHNNDTHKASTQTNINNGEKEFLLSVKERILVLFEGLNNFDKGDIEARVELNLKFMEFLLATIEDRLKKLP